VRGEGRIPIGVTLAFSAPSLASAGLALPIYVLMPKFYSDVVLAPLGFIAIAIALARAFDALTDPAMGWISDHTRTRFGRRLPWIALGTPLTALVVIALFGPPASLSPSASAAWFAATFTLYFLFHAVYWIPYSALGYELTLDYHERSVLFGWREAFALAGTLLAGVTPFVAIEVLDDERKGYLTVGVTFAVLLVGSFAWLLLRVRERPDFATREANPLAPGVRRALRNRPFRVLLFAYMVSSLTGAIPVTVAPYYLAYVLRPENFGLWLSLAIGGYVATGIAAIPFWVWLARRQGKRMAWFVSIWVAVAGSTPLFFLGEGDLLPFVVLILFTGTQLGAGLLHPAMQADVIDYDELHFGKRREAQYAAFWAIVPKFVAIPSAAIPLSILSSLGYVPNEVQSAEIQLALRAMLGLGPAATSLASFFIALRFPMTEARHRAILEGIERHRRGEAALDPLTGAFLEPPDRRGLAPETGWFLDHFSRGELMRVLERGPGRALRDVLAVATACFAATVLLAAWIVGGIDDLTFDPGISLTLGVVVAGFALTSFLFHLLRIGPALAMRRAPVAPEIIRAHLALNGGVELLAEADAPAGAGGA
jgi:GPH family glycoside/pentoside/hexuronide:cation symporter